MKLLIICPGKMAKDKSQIKCYSDLLNYYLPKALVSNADCDIKSISVTPNANNIINQLKEMSLDGYDAMVFLGIRFFSHQGYQPKKILDYLRGRFKGLICQTHDGSRFNNDGVDITFTTKNEDKKWQNTKAWEEHKNYNHYVGWGADSELNVPKQDLETLTILIDHTNYGNNPIDSTKEVILQVQKLIQSRKWESKFKSIKVRRFISGGVDNVTFSRLDKIEKFDRSKVIPITEITKEHCKAHLFMVTHPESVGLVVLETSLAGALTVSPNNYINQDRLDTVRHYKYLPNTDIEWDKVLGMINPSASRNCALNNSWDAVAKRLIKGLKDKLRNE